MSLQRWIIAGLWLLFVAYWAVAAVGGKRSAGAHPWRKEIGLRLVVILQYAAYKARTGMLAPCPLRRR